MSNNTNVIKRTDYAAFSTQDLSRILGLETGTIQQKLNGKPLGSLLLSALNQQMLLLIKQKIQAGQTTSDQMNGCPPPGNQILPKNLNCYQWAVLKSNLPVEACQQILFTVYKTSAFLLEAMKKWGLVQVETAPMKNDLVFYYNHSGQLAHMGLCLGNSAVMAKAESGTTEVLLHPIDEPISEGIYSSYEVYHLDETQIPEFDSSATPQFVYEKGQWKLLTGTHKKAPDSKRDYTE